MRTNACELAVAVLLISATVGLGHEIPANRPRLRPPAQSMPWSWLNSDNAGAQDGDVFKWGHLWGYNPVALCHYTPGDALSLQRYLYWDFESPWPEFPWYGGVDDPRFADYAYDPVADNLWPAYNPPYNLDPPQPDLDPIVHNGCDVYNLTGDVHTLPGDTLEQIAGRIEADWLGHVNDLNPIGVNDLAVNPQNANDQTLGIDSGEVIYFHLNNRGDLRPQTIKYIWWQFSYYNPSPVATGAWPQIFQPVVQNAGMVGTLEGWAHDPAPGQDWGTFSMLWSIVPNPESETLGIANSTGDSIMIDDQLVVTMCIPEPCSILSAGGLLMCLVAGRSRSRRA
jgi:hypothetical protein